MDENERVLNPEQTARFARLGVAAPMTLELFNPSGPACPTCGRPQPAGE